MAFATAYTAFNMATFKFWKGSVVENSPGEIVVTDGTRVGTYWGEDLSTREEYAYWGTITAYSQSKYGFDSFYIGELSANELTFNNLVKKSPKKLFEFIFNGDDELNGSDDNDYLMGFSGNDIIDGGLGVDTLDGGDGNDIYYVDSAEDKVIEKQKPSEDSIDQVISSVNYTLGKGSVEGLVLDGWDAISGTGNNTSNFITGNEWNNFLNGKGGSDWLTGGAGADEFIFDVKLGDELWINVDTISDFVSGTDTIYLSKRIFTRYEAGIVPSDDLVFGDNAMMLRTNERFLYENIIPSIDNMMFSFVGHERVGVLSYDADGGGPKNALPFAVLIGAPLLLASDLHIF